MAPSSSVTVLRTSGLFTYLSSKAHVRIMYAPVHTLSKKSAQQQRNVFIWCCYEITMGKVLVTLAVSNRSSDRSKACVLMPTHLSASQQYIAG